MKGKLLIALLLIFASACNDKKTYVTKHVYERDTTHAYPFISGDLFRYYSHHVVDETHIPFSPRSVKPGEIVFVKAKYLGKFFKYMHPAIKERYILITGNGDEEVPGEYAAFLDDEKLLMWFGMNATSSHPKLIPIPIGTHGNGAKLDLKAQWFYSLFENPLKKERLLYLNFTTHNHAERAMARRLFTNKPFCTFDANRTGKEFLEEIMRSKFVLCPRGNGLDTHRVWESLMLGSIPILKSNALDPLYEDLPVLIVKDWDEVTEEFLEKKYKEIWSKNYNYDKLYADYWLNLIDSYSTENPKRANFSKEQDCVNRVLMKINDKI